MVQLMHGLAKKRRINRNGYWYSLNHSLFKQTSGRKFSSWLSETNSIIEFMRTGKGRLVGDKVIFDRPDKKFKDYLDSDEAMEAKERPKWEPKEVFIRDINKIFDTNKR
jgi:hypothetical protein